MKIKQSIGEQIFDKLNILLLALFCLTIIVPFFHIIAGSLSSSVALNHSEVKLLPVGFNLDNYKKVLANKHFWDSFRISFYITIVGTLINVVLTSLTAYPLSKPSLRLRKQIMLYFIFTMIFSAPLIPTYLVVKSFGMVNTLWALIIPSALSVFNLILCITFFKGLPEELFDAAKVDGMSEYGILFRIVVPLSLPIMTTLTLYYAVGHWNTYGSAIIYITKSDLRPLQLYLYAMIAQGDLNDVSQTIQENLDTTPEGLIMATILVATVPIMMIYPFIQKHFIKGSLVGSVKE